MPPCALHHGRSHHGERRGRAERGPAAVENVARGEQRPVDRHAPGGREGQLERQVPGGRTVEQFTVGQRSGLGIATGSPLYVIRIEADTRRIVVGPRSAVPEREAVVAAATWLGPEPVSPFPCDVQCRAQRTAAPAVVTPLAAGRFHVRFTGGPERSPGPISPGQPAVCYQGDRVLGGGWIEA